MQELAQLLQEISAGKDSFLELNGVVFKGDQVRLAREDGRASTNLAEVFVSMANTEGGRVVFGVSDSRTVLGIGEERRDLLEQFVINVGLNNCQPPVEPLLDWVKLPDPAGELRLCLVASIPKARFYVHATVDGRYLKRVGSHRSLIPPEQLGRLLTQRAIASPFEERPIYNESFDVLDTDRFAAYLRRRFGDDGGGDIAALQQRMVNLKLAVRDESSRLRPTVLGILLFADRPDRFLDGAFVEVAEFPGRKVQAESSDSRRIVGPVPEQIEQLLHYFRGSRLVAHPSLKDGLGRTDTERFSGLAFQEAIVNALVHRDYSITGSQSRVLFFDDRIEIANPGGLHNSLTVEDLFSGCVPIRRNQLLAGFLRDFQSSLTGKSYFEGGGFGFTRMVDATEQLSGRRPSLRIQSQAVHLTLWAPAG